MFSFEKNDTYQKAKIFNLEIRYFLREAKMDWSTKNQLSRSSMSIMLNIAEGFGRFTNPDRRHFMIMARSSIFETVAILEIIKESKELSENLYQQFYDSAEEISKILYATIKTLSSKNQ